VLVVLVVLAPFRMEVRVDKHWLSWYRGVCYVSRAASTYRPTSQTILRRRTAEWILLRIRPSPIAWGKRLRLSADEDSVDSHGPGVAPRRK
jgi:hypothetical protein